VGVCGAIRSRTPSSCAQTWTSLCCAAHCARPEKRERVTQRGGESEGGVEKEKVRGKGRENARDTPSDCETSGLQYNYGAVRCSMLQRVAVCYSVRCCSGLQNGAVCCSELRYVVMCCNVLLCVAVCCSVLQCVAVCYSSLQFVALCCNVLQYVTVCCSVAVSCNML